MLLPESQHDLNITVQQLVAGKVGQQTLDQAAD